MSSVDFSTSSMRPSTLFCASSAWPSARAYRCSILSRTSSRLGVLPGADSCDIEARLAETCSCILACSSWVSSLLRSASLVCTRCALSSTAVLACWAACSAWSCSDLRSSIDCSAATSCVAKVCAVCSYCAALAVSPAARAWSASTRDWRAEPCSFSTSLIWRASFISSWRWLPMTAAACCVSCWCWRCASSIACWIWIFGSLCSSSLPDSSAMTYFQPRTRGLAIVVLLLW